jgi:hypothetical protein
MIEGSSHIDAAQLLWISLEPAASDGEIRRDPDEFAPAVRNALVLASHDEEGLEILRSRRVEKFGL